MKDFSISKEDILEASHRVAPYVHRTPLFRSSFFNELTGADVYFKCENLQKTGSFKIRGATNALLSLSAGELTKGVATHSSGNHAQALAFAASRTGTSAHVVMPSNSSQVKKSAVKNYGAEIVECDTNLQSREETLQRVVNTTGATFIPPFNDFSIVAGQATCAREIFDELGNVDYLFAPVGGGGLISGSLLSGFYFSPKTKIVAAEPEGAGDTFLSVNAGQIVAVEQVNTIADGLRTTVGDKTFPIIKALVDQVVLVSDMEIISAMRWVWERMKLIVEPSGVVSLAAALKIKDQLKHKKVAVIFSGGNCNLSLLPF